MEKELVFVDTSLDGVSLAFQAALRGFKITYSSPNEYVLSVIRKGKAPGVLRRTQLQLILEERMSVAVDVQKVIGDHEIVILTRDAHSLEGDSRMELTTLSKMVGSAIRRGSLIVYSGVCLPGTVEDVIMQNVEKASGLQVGFDVDLAYISPMKGTKFLAEKSKLQGRTMELASNLWGDEKIVTLDGIKEAEAASTLKLMENEALEAVAYEALLLFEQLDVDVKKVFECVGEHLVPNAVRDPNATGIIRYLTQGEGMLFQGTRLLHQVEKTIDAGVNHGITHLKELIKQRSRDQRGRIKLFVVADTEEDRKRILTGVKSRRCIAESYLTADLIDKLHSNEKRDLNERLKKADLVILFSNYSELREYASTEIGDKKALFDFSMLQALPKQ